jgi:hypothetical protein
LKYLTNIVYLLLFQTAFTYAIVKAGTGGGSFVGLGALLFAVVGIPATAVVNVVLIRAYPAKSGLVHFGRSFMVAVVLPLAQLALLVAVSVFRL